MTDNDWLLGVLADGEWHDLREILARSFRERDCGLTVHSRVSDLRRDYGCTIEQESFILPSGRRGSRYRLIRTSVQGAPALATVTGDVNPFPSPVPPGSLFAPETRRPEWA